MHPASTFTVRLAKLDDALLAFIDAYQRLHLIQYATADRAGIAGADSSDLDHDVTMAGCCL